MFVGNDIVDIRTPYAASKACDERFLERVFSDEEKGFIKMSPDPVLTLWSIWSAKETAFKIAKKQNPLTVFCHNEFCVHNPPQEFGSSVGHVSFHDHEYFVRWDACHHHVHCVGASCHGELYFSAAHLDEEAEDESKRVRHLAQELLLNSLHKKAEIVRMDHEGKLSPPTFISKSHHVDDIDLSLSHDGKFIAAAVGRKDKSKFIFSDYA